jgi:hypothetical protein
MNVLIKNCISLLFIFTLIIGCKSDKIAENGEEIIVSTPIESQPKAKEKQAEPTKVVEVKKVENDEALVKVDLKKEDEKPKPSSKPASKPKSVDKPKPNKPKPVKKPKPKPLAKNAKLSFESLTYDFGEIEEGDVFEHKFKFENSGNDTLVVTGADATCGCTTPSYPFIPLLPGDVGYIGVRYNSVGKDGLQQPTITVYTNAEPKIYKLKLTGTVNKKEKEEEKEKEE